MPATAHANVVEQFRIFTLATTATSHSLSCRLRRALCSATNEDEQAVSIVEDGPCKPKSRSNKYNEWVK